MRKMRSRTASAVKAMAKWRSMSGRRTANCAGEAEARARACRLAVTFFRQRIEVTLDGVVVTGRDLLGLQGLTDALTHLAEGIPEFVGPRSALADFLCFPLEQHLSARQRRRRFFRLESRFRGL